MLEYINDARSHERKIYVTVFKYTLNPELLTVAIIVIMIIINNHYVNDDYDSCP
jgi:hypothetical protein